MKRKKITILLLSLFLIVAFTGTALAANTPINRTIYGGASQTIMRNLIVYQTQFGVGCTGISFQYCDDNKVTFRAYSGSTAATDKIEHFTTTVGKTIYRGYLVNLPQNATIDLKASIPGTDTKKFASFSGTAHH